MIDPEVIDQRLVKIRESVRLLCELREHSFEEFVSNAIIYSATLYTMQIGVQAVIDICQHLVSEKQLKMPTRLSDLPALLVPEGILPADLSDRLAAMIGMRNVIVHEYLKVDLHRVYKAIRDHLGDFDEFARCIVEYLEKEGLA